MQGATEDRWLVSRWDRSSAIGPISVLRIQRAVSLGNTEESVGLGALSSLVHPSSFPGGYELSHVATCSAALEGYMAKLHFPRAGIV